MDETFTPGAPSDWAPNLRVAQRAASLAFHLHRVGLRVSPSSKANRSGLTKAKGLYPILMINILLPSGLSINGVQEWVKLYHIKTAQAHLGEERDRGFKSIGTGPWPSALVDPWGELVHYNEARVGALSACDNTVPALPGPGGWGDRIENTEVPNREG